MLVDDDALMRAGLRAVISSDDGLEVVGEAADGREAVARAPRLAPDVVLMDVRMPELDGIAATRELLAVAPHAKVLVLTTFEEDEYVFGALAAGAAGFVLKRTRPEDLLAAIRTVADGDALLSPAVTRRVVERVVDRSAGAPRDDGERLAQLTPRERDVLDLVARGLTNREVAAALVVEESTVKTHVKRVLAKLGLRDRVQAVIYAYEHGLVRPGE
nr:response regulator transcription factor [Conexibacter arvalis]